MSDNNFFENQNSDFGEQKEIKNFDETENYNEQMNKNGYSDPISNNFENSNNAPNFSYYPNNENNYAYSAEIKDPAPEYHKYNPYSGKEQKKVNKKGIKITISVFAVVAFLTAVCLFGYWALGEVKNIIGVYDNSSSSQKENKNNESYENIIINSKPNGSTEYTKNSDGTLSSAAVIKKVRPSIVGIIQYVNSNVGIPTMNSQGSGIIVSKDGYIVTNAHVVNGASMITVVLDNDEEYRATIKGLDEQSDLAIIKIDAKNLSAAELGNSDELVVGENVIAIGNPGGLELAGTCTGGMISGLNRTISSETSGYAMKYIQTDAAINPGNSGGALVNMYGQVIGINSVKVTADGYEGLGFAIPVNEALPIINDLQQYGYVKDRARIGIGFQFISEMVATYYNLPIKSGLIITSIDESCDIAKRNVEINDIITKIDGKDVTSTSVVYSVLQSKKPGEKIKLTLYRMGARLASSKTLEVEVVLAENKGED